MQFMPRAYHLGPPAQLEPPRPGLLLQAASIDPTGNALALWRESHSVVIVSHTPETTELLTIERAPWDLRFVQPLPRDRFLVVEGWSGPENAWVVDLTGEIVQASNVGPYVGQVFATDSGDVWIGYSDMGVFDGDSLSGHGLVRFDESLQPRWKFVNKKSRHTIDDCEGVNVHRDTVWMCPYVEFPVLRVRGEEVDVWSNLEFQTNIGAVLVDEAARAVGLVATGWSAYPGTCVVGNLTDTAFEPSRALVLRLPNGAALPGDAELTGKGSQLHIVHGHDWYRVDLQDLH
jgi:hypothetical protein